ncbi:MAG: adenine-specific methyltransferase EcoRI family protein [Phycisphaeraceae bacterium]
MNQSLSAAKAAKKDEFYTQYIDIQKEVEAYLEYDPDTFRSKVIYCNCDDPFESNFFKYFAANFNRLGLKKLITTSYDGSPIAGQQTSLFPEFDQADNKRRKPHGASFAIEIEEVTDINGDGATDIEDVKLFLEHNPHSRKALKGGGDFRSDECVELLKSADIVVTNPPFSLFREFVALLMECDKKFLIIGNQSALTTSEIFPLIRENKMWLGVDNGGTKWFEVKDDYDIKTESRKKTENGKKYFSMGSIMWYTNLDHGRRHQELPLMTMADNLKFNKKLSGKTEYDAYDNYVAIEIPTYKSIPTDYEGVMGVPITFVDKYNPDQFEIVGSDYEVKQGLHPELVRDNWDGKLDRGYIGGKRMFARILIRHRKKRIKH